MSFMMDLARADVVKETTIAEVKEVFKLDDFRARAIKEWDVVLYFSRWDCGESARRHLATF